MQILKNENWKYEIWQDKLQLDEVKSFCTTLKGLEKEIMQKEIEHYSKFFSFDQVIKNLIYYKDKEEISKYLKRVKANIENIVYLPDELLHLYELKIEKFCEQKNELIKIMHYANDFGVFPNMNNLYSTIFGKKIYKKVLAMNKKYAKRFERIDKESKLPQNQYEQFINDLRKNCFNDYNTHGVWGQYQNKDFNLLVNEQNGKGSFKSRKISLSNDTYIINSNGNTINPRQLTTSFYLNIYPGYSHFYNNVIDDNANNLKFDSGASFLINGWATFAAWHYKPNNYTRYRKDKMSKLISFLLKNNNKKGTKKLYMYLLSTYGKSFALDLYKKLTQYRGQTEASILGSFATELLINSKFCLGPKDYLDKLKQNNVGDFFQYYFQIAKKKKILK